MKSTMSRKEYLSWILVVVVPVIFFGFCEYRNYPIVKDQTDAFSQFMLLLAISTTNLLLGFFITIRRFRNALSIFMIYLITLGCFLIPFGYNSMLRVFQTRLKYVFLLPILLMIKRSFHIFMRRIPKEKDVKKIIEIRFEKMAYVTWQSYCTLIVLFMITSVVWQYIPTNMLYKYNLPIHVSKSGISTRQYLDQHKEQMLKIGNEWEAGKLDRKEKLKICQVILEAEALNLELQGNLDIAVVDLNERKDDKEPIMTFGCYDNRTHTIFLDRRHLDAEPPVSVINTLLHEIRHVYQHELCDAYENAKAEDKESYRFSDVPDFIKSMKNYQSYQDSGSFEAYYTQEIEEDSRFYAKSQIVYYNWLLSQYEQEQFGVKNDK